MNQVVRLSRTRQYFRQLGYSFIFKIAAIAITFLLVPLLLKNMGAERYGVWSTIMSITSWFLFFDFGIGNGLRNEVAKYKAADDLGGLKDIISGAYTLIGIVVAIILLLVMVVGYLMPWSMVFNTKLVPFQELRNAFLVIGVFVTANLWLGLILQVLNGLQKSSQVVFNQFLVNATFFLTVYVSGWQSLFDIAVAYGVCLVACSLLISLNFYFNNKFLFPRFFYDKKIVGPLLTVGGKFFLIQLAVLVIFSTDRMLIIQLFGPGHVTDYDISYKLFSAITVMHGLICAPLWSSYSDAFYRRDFYWIKKAIIKQLFVFVVLTFGVLALFLLSKPILNVWVGGQGYDKNLLVSLSIFVVISVWNNVFATLLNAIGEIRLQMVTSIIAMLINIPLSVFFVYVLHFSMVGIVFATCISLSIFAIFGPFQVRRIINGGMNEKSTC